jgi:hypothetical protein
MTKRDEIINFVLAVAFCGLVLSGCAQFWVATMSPANVVTGLERTFPTLQRLQVGVYMLQGDCEYFVYARGYFTSKPSDQYCRVFLDARHLGDPPTPIAFDDQARVDLDAVKVAFNDAGLSVTYLNLGFTLSITNAANAFAVDTCRVFSYSPGWTALPDQVPDAVSSGINPDWYVTDNCARQPLPS